jgi:hypothetical protein
MEHNGKNKKIQHNSTLSQKEKEKTWAPWVHGALPHCLQGFFFSFFAYLCSLSFLA